MYLFRLIFIYFPSGSKSMPKKHDIFPKSFILNWDCIVSLNLLGRSLLLAAMIKSSNQINTMIVSLSACFLYTQWSDTFLTNDHLEVYTSFFRTVLVRKWISLVCKLIFLPSQMSFQNPVVVLRKSLHLLEHV